MNRILASLATTITLLLVTTMPADAAIVDRELQTQIDQICDTTHSTSVLPGAVKSIANARSSGTVTAHNSGGSTLSTLRAGASVAVAPGNISSVKCAS